MTFYIAPKSAVPYGAPAAPAIPVHMIGWLAQFAKNNFITTTKCLLDARSLVDRVDPPCRISIQWMPLVDAICGG